MKIIQRMSQKEAIFHLSVALSLLLLPFFFPQNKRNRNEVILIFFFFFSKLACIVTSVTAFQLKS